MTVKTLLARVPIDRFLLLLIVTVAVAAVLPARGRAAVAVDWISFAAVAVLFFVYGARLAPQAVWEGLRHWRLQGLVLASTFVLFPLLGLLFQPIAAQLLPPELALGVLFLCLLPSTVQSSIAFTSIAGGNVPAAFTSASVSNLLGVVVTPLLVLALAHAGGGFGLDPILKIAVQILAPFVLGQLARPLIGGWLARHRPVTVAVDRGTILVVVYAAFSEGVVSGVWSRVGAGDLAVVVFADCLILALALGATRLASRRLGFRREDEIAIVFCGSKKSMATGIPMANILFAGRGVALVVLPLMLFHQLQLFACAVIAQRYAKASRPPEARPSPEAAAETVRDAAEQEV